MAEQKDIDAIRDFVREVQLTHKTDDPTEHTYRPVLKIMLDKLGKEKKVRAINERKRIDCGAPDITLMHNDIAIGYLEAKDIGVPIRNHRGVNKNQFDRYTNDLDNLIYTDYLKWDFYRDGINKPSHSISIAELNDDVITPTPNNYAKLANYLQDFLDQRPQTITTADNLTTYMAKKTRLMRYSFEEGLSRKPPVKSLENQYKTVSKELIRGLKKKEFADMYAQTVTYGLFAAWLDNKTPDKFNRQDIDSLLPDDYPFLKNLFEFITAKTPDKGLDWAIDDLMAVYRAADVERIKKTYGKASGYADIFIHFYEDFLKKYDAEKRKTAGVYYTPEPIVDFIVRGVDWVLKNKLDVRDGLASTEKTDVVWNTDRITEDEIHNVHKVQILDPATGTGTFLAQTIRHIAKQVKPSAPNSWSSYVDKDLLPRLHGLEMMMAPYTMAYLKLASALKELEYKPTPDKPKRMHVYLTNSLAEANKDVAELGYNEWLEDEARGARDIKINKPIMCVIGNPPYSAVSQNKGESAKWIHSLINEYKYVDGKPFGERKHWLYDDYVKFIRLAQKMVDTNSVGGRGVIGMITNHGYLDNPTFRGMRESLLRQFNEIYILDLHGSSIKKELCPNGNPDKNVFDITVGVSIIIAWAEKTYAGQEIFPAKVFHADLWGTREEKFNALRKEGLGSKIFEQIAPRTPYYFFKPKNYDLFGEYEKGFKITEFMKDNSTGIVTMGDNFIIDSNKTVLHNKLIEFLASNITELALKSKFKLGKNYAKWVLENKGKIQLDSKKLVKINYRPFDTRWTYFDNKLLWRWRKDIMHHFLEGDNLGLVISRSAVGQPSWQEVQCTDKIIEFGIMSTRPGNGTPVFPLYLYPDGKSFDANIRVNMKPTIRKAIEDAATDAKHGKPDEHQIFDYIYGLLHAPEYRTRYLEFLKADFPRIPYPETPAEFWHLSSIGTKLRDLHLMKGNFNLATYKFDGANTTPKIEIPCFANGRVWINKTQYFDNVPESAWDFYIGGYQPAQKWLKDRKEQVLDYENICHYQRIIAVLVQTEQTMKTIKWSRP